MRLSTVNSYDATIATLQRRQQEMSDAQVQLTTGKRVNRASDDPTAAARAERARATQSRADAGKRAADASQNAMQLTESALGDASDLLQQARESLVAAGNGSYSDADRSTLATKLTELRRQLLSVANRTDGAGTYLFGGQGAATPPFVDTAAGVQYRGVGGQIGVASDETLPITTDGQATWLQAPTGNGVVRTSALVQNGSAWIDAGGVSNPALVTGATYTIDFSVAAGATTYTVLKNGAPMVPPVANQPFTSGTAITVDGLSATITGAPANGDQFQLAPSTPTQSVFNALDSAIQALSTPGLSKAQVQQGVNGGIRDIDSVMGRMQSVRASVGETLNRIDNVTSRLADQKLSAKGEESQAEDLDMVKAISDFQNQQSGYDAALKSYSMVQRLSLFQYLNGG